MPALDFGDCDRCGSARALYLVTTPAGDLGFCGHDFRVSEITFRQRGYLVLGPHDIAVSRHTGIAALHCAYCQEEPVAWIEWKHTGRAVVCAFHLARMNRPRDGHCPVVTPFPGRAS